MMIPTLWALVTISFFMMHVAPGGPFDGERALPPAIKENLLKAYHLDQPVYIQYVHYLGNLLRGDLGPSYKFRDWTVNGLISKGFPVSLKLGCYAMLVAVILGILLGAFAAFRKNSKLDAGLMFFATSGISIPNFVVGPVLILLFSITLAWLPGAGWNDGALPNMILPVITLAIPQLAIISRIMRGSMIEVLKSNFIRTAKAKGLSSTRIIFYHALRPSLIPVVSYWGPAMAGVITGSVVVEQIFGLPGVGTLLIQGATNRDYTTVLGLTILFGSLIVLFNFIVDILYGILDPKVRL